jgi:hypothetical protein
MHLMKFHAVEVMVSRVMFPGTFLCFYFLVKHESRTYCYSGCVTDGQGAITLIVKLRGHYFPFYGEKEIWKCGNSSTFLSIQVFSSISSALAFYDIFVDARLTYKNLSTLLQICQLS